MNKTCTGSLRRLLLLLLIMMHAFAPIQAGFLKPTTRHLYSTMLKPRIEVIAGPNFASSASVFDEESTFELDTETRRQRRLDRLNQIPKSNIPSVGINFMEHKQRQVKKEAPKNPLGEKFLADVNQHNSILSDAPAILLESGAGTGKTTVLAGRIAHLLRRNEIGPQNMIILSFTRRDAEALKVKAMEMMDEGGVIDIPLKNTIEGQLWCGTIHSFAINILRKYNCNDAPLRIISTKVMKNRIRSCLGRINGSGKERLMKYKSALEDSKQSIGTLVHYIVRCLELWKEAGLLSTPYSYSIKFQGMDDHEDNDNSLNQDDYVELAMRLGIPQNAALLALDISAEYQTTHAGMGTADPADVALMAHDFLMSNPDALHSVRSKLQQIVLDEYQDVSVSQHKLLRLIILGAEDEEIQRHDANQHHKSSNRNTKMPILLGNDPISTKSPRHDIICYRVPKIICAGDSNQSIYGWRGAAPSLTVEGFRNDFPQGLVVPLGTNYRLPRHILNAANVLIGQEQIASHSISYDVSPAAAMSISDLVENHQRNCGVEDSIDETSIADSSCTKGQQLLLEEGLMEESRSSVFIQGLWDQREEAKFIASEIRKRSKERSSAFAKVLRKFENGDGGGMKEESIFDSTDVAIMVRSSTQLKLIEEALKKNGIPFLDQRGGGTDTSDTSASTSAIMFRGRQTKLLAMKPVRLITMHKAKGDEFDDVYLAGWTEGVFPHPSSLSTNRVHEERRIAYVALTRARQRVVITYAFMKRVSYFGSNGNRKEVTEPVEPSRFLYDLTEEKAVEWSDSYGFKESVAGRNLPDEYANSYKIPSGYTKNRISGKLPQNKSKYSEEPPEEKEAVSSAVTPDDSMIVLLNEVLHGLDEIFARKRGSRGKYKVEFRCLLKEFGINRGSALILTTSGEKQFEKMATALVSIPDHFVTTRPLSRCTAEQLGLYFVYLLHQEE